MLRTGVWGLMLVFVTASCVQAQECKVKFAVAYTDGKSVQIGFTEDQKQFWDHDGPKKFKGMCFDATKPDFLIMWTLGVTGTELAQTSRQL